MVDRLVPSTEACNTSGFSEFAYEKQDKYHLQTIRGTKMAEDLQHVENSKRCRTCHSMLNRRLHNSHRLLSILALCPTNALLLDISRRTRIRNMHQTPYLCLRWNIFCPLWNGQPARFDWEAWFTQSRWAPYKELSKWTKCNEYSRQTQFDKKRIKCNSKTLCAHSSLRLLGKRQTILRLHIKRWGDRLFTELRRIRLIASKSIPPCLVHLDSFQIDEAAKGTGPRHAQNRPNNAARAGIAQRFALSFFLF